MIPVTLGKSLLNLSLSFLRCKMGVFVNHLTGFGGCVSYEQKGLAKRTRHQ